MHVFMIKKYIYILFVSHRNAIVSCLGC
jgi:hypothetical protein